MPKLTLAYMLFIVNEEGTIKGAAEAVAHSLIAQNMVSGAQGVRDWLVLALHMLIRAAFQRLCRRLARTTDPDARRPARPRPGNPASDQPQNPEPGETPVAKIPKRRKSWLSALLPNGREFKLAIIAPPNPNSLPPPGTETPRSQRTEPPDPPRAKGQWETLGWFPLHAPAEPV